MAKNQEQLRIRLTDAVFGRLVVDIRELFAAMPSEQKADLDGEFLTAIAEQPNEILKCAMYLFLGYIDGATQFAQSCGGGGTLSDLPWGRNTDEDDRRYAYRCMMQAHRMMKPSQPKRRIGITDDKIINSLIAIVSKLLYNFAVASLWFARHFK